jgi:hypothetical protein
MRPQRFTNFAAGAATTKCSILYRPALFVDFGKSKCLLRIQESPEVLLLRYTSCEAASASRMPKPETLSAYYSRPSPVESAIRQDPFRTLAAHLMKSLSRLLAGWPL